VLKSGKIKADNILEEINTCWVRWKDRLDRRQMTENNVKLQTHRTKKKRKNKETAEMKC
jgi:hypothetical protein